MQALIGYLLALTVFVGGGYAGTQWLITPDDLPSAVAIKKSTDPLKSTRARLLARKRHEAAAERAANATPAVNSPSAPEQGAATVAQARDDQVVTDARDGNMATKAELVKAEPVKDKSPSVAAIGAPAETRKSQISWSSQNATARTVPEAGVISTPGTIDVAAAVSLEATISGAAASSNGDVSAARPDTGPQPRAEIIQPLQRRAAMTSEPAVAEKKASAVSREARIAYRRERVAQKPPAQTRLTSSARKPVMMILRTIEFPDGRRVQRLLPMPRYRQASAFADD